MITGPLLLLLVRLGLPSGACEQTVPRHIISTYKFIASVVAAEIDDGLAEGFGIDHSEHRRGVRRIAVTLDERLPNGLPRETTPFMPSIPRILVCDFMMGCRTYAVDVSDFVPGVFKRSI
jgi:hypothetical protein